MTSLDTMLGALLGVPALPGARCRGRSHLFDEAAPEEPDHVVAARQLQALGLCEHCPALDPCEAWLMGLPPSKRPVGVIAGRINHPPKPRKKKAKQL